MSGPVITSGPLVSIPGRSIAICPDPDPDWTGQAFYTVELDGETPDVSWWEMPSDVRGHANQILDDGDDTAYCALWDTIATIIEKAANK